MMSVETQQVNKVPCLPTELEREIFELTATAHRETAVQLALVARRVQIWVERLIYQVVSLSDRRKCSSFLRTIDTRPAEFFTTHVRAICLPYFLDHSQASRILALCPHVEDLGCWAQRGPTPLSSGILAFVGPAPAAFGADITIDTSSSPPTPSSSSPSSPHPSLPSPSLSSDVASNVIPRLPRPRRLSVNLRDLFPTLSPNSPISTNPTTPSSSSASSNPDFSHPLFSNITHLRVIDGWISWTRWSWSDMNEHVQNLTHLALDVSGVSVVPHPHQHLHNQHIHHHNANTNNNNNNNNIHNNGYQLPPLITLALERILRGCGKLEVCVLFTTRYEVKAMQKALDSMSAMGNNNATDLMGPTNAMAGGRDPRLVVLAYANPMENWEAGVRGDEQSCHWRVAEGIVKARKAGE